LNRPVAIQIGANFSALQFSPLARDYSLVQLAPGEAGPLRLAAEIVRREAVLVHIDAGEGARHWVSVAIARMLGARVVVAPVALGIDCAPFRKYNRAPSDAGAPLKLVYSGPLAREQGLYEAVEALRLARFRNVATRLVIAGSGPEEPRLRQRVRDLALGRDVGFTGPVEGEQKARLLSQADVLVLPSYGGPLPPLLLEGMAAGAVPIASATEAMAKVVVDGVHGHLVPSRDPEALSQAIGRLAADRASLLRMSAACRKRIAGAYSVERVAAELSQIYAGLGPLRSAKPVS
jgi:glycosyltransferase involved in cell wall biosynthesis